MSKSEQQFRHRLSKDKSSRESKIKITVHDFIYWYFKAKDSKWLLEDIRWTLKNEHRYSLELMTLFKETGSIPSHLRIDYDPQKHLGEYYPTELCQLI